LKGPQQDDSRPEPKPNQNALPKKKGWFK